MACDPEEVTRAGLRGRHLLAVLDGCHADGHAERLLVALNSHAQMLRVDVRDHVEAADVSLRHLRAHAGT